MEVLNVAMAALVEKGQERTFVVIEDADHPDQFVQYELHDGVVVGEVGSRQWVEPYHPLSADAEVALGVLGFVGGAPQHNYVRDGLPVDAIALARLTEELFEAGYGRRNGLDVVISTNSEEVYALLEGQGAWVGRLLSGDRLVVKPLDLGDIERLLERRKCRVFRDQQAGGLMTYWGWDATLGTEVKVFINVGAEGEVLRISATADRPACGRRRWAELLRICNEWNNEVRWPRAYLNTGRHQGKDFGWVETSVDIPISTGIHPAFVEDLLDRVIPANLRFFSFVHEKVDWSTLPGTTRR